MWEYADRPSGGGTSTHYETAGIDDMIAMAPQFHAMRPAAGGVMLMWCVGPHFESVCPLMRAWGYEPIKPIWYWVKLNPDGSIFRGGGAYTQSNVEFVMLGQALGAPRYMPTNRKSKGGSGIGVPEPIYAPIDDADHAAMLADEAIAVSHPRERGRIIHSKKPRIFYDMAIQLWGDVPRVEVFARERYAGWHAIGDQLPGGERIASDRIIRPIPPPPIDIAHRRHGALEQLGLFGSQDTDGYLAGKGGAA
jgi:site-specific DNA-methyltransferase (adenine-specific)